MTKSEFVFAYGSNMDPAQMRERCPESDLSWFVAEARNWRLSFPRESIKRGGGVGSITRAEGPSVWGVVFAVSERDLTRLDDFEGVGAKAYKREYIDVFDVGGRRSTVWTYIAVPVEPGDFAPHKDYIALYVKGASYFGLPATYVDSLKRLAENSKQT